LPKAIEDDAARVLEFRTVKLGRDAWETINKSESFEAWKKIGAALAIGKLHALKVTGANATWGRNYSREFSDWVKRHGFDRMPAPTRSVAIELHENAAAIEAWRAMLPEHRRKRLVHPLSNVRAWRAATAAWQTAAQGLDQSGPESGPKRSTNEYTGDLARDALAHWRQFCACIEALPAEQAANVWRTVSVEIVALRGREAIAAQAAYPVLTGRFYRFT
jgi:hypothetical protein